MKVVEPVCFIFKAVPPCLPGSLDPLAPLDLYPPTPPDPRTLPLIKITEFRTAKVGSSNLAPGFLSNKPFVNDPALPLVPISSE